MSSFDQTSLQTGGQAASTCLRKEIDRVFCSMARASWLPCWLVFLNLSRDFVYFSMSFVFPVVGHWSRASVFIAFSHEHREPEEDTGWLVWGSNRVRMGEAHENAYNTWLCKLLGKHTDDTDDLHGKVLGWQICRHSGLSLFYQDVHHCTQKVDGPRFWKMDILVSRRQAQRLSDSLMLPQSTESFQSAGRSTQKNTTTLNIIHAARLGPRLSLKMCSISPRCCFLGWRPDHSAVCKCPLTMCLTRGDSQASSFLWVSAMSPLEDLNTISELSHCFYSRHLSPASIL